MKSEKHARNKEKAINNNRNQGHWCNETRQEEEMTTSRVSNDEGRWKLGQGINGEDFLGYEKEPRQTNKRMGRRDEEGRRKSVVKKREVQKTLEDEDNPGTQIFNPGT